MKHTDWLKELMTRARVDPEYQSSLREVKRLEPEFQALRDSLSRNQQDILEDYLSACEEMDHALTALAWNRPR